MKNTKTEKILRLLLFLCRQPECTKSTILNSIECDERTFFNYIHDIRKVGFVVKCKTGRYSIVKKNDAYRAFQQILNISIEESFHIDAAIQKLHLDENMKKDLLVRLAGTLQSSEQLLPPNSSVQKNIKRAILEKKQLIVREHCLQGDYPKSFIIEAYSMDNNNEYCWAYIATMNKNIKFKIEDIKSVSLSPIQCLYTPKHLKIENDVLGNYGVLNYDVSIYLTEQGAKKLVKKYPVTKIFIKKDNDSNIYHFATKLCKYDSIISFILFNPKLIISVNNPQLIDGIQEWLSKTTKRFTHSKNVIEN